ncbi:MAG: hypothetical protein AAF290_09870 [Pseudomonadota bacterium]
MTQLQDVQIRPWYREPMVWLMLGIPAATVLGCLFTIYLAVTHPDPVYSRSATTTDIRPAS